MEFQPVNRAEIIERIRCLGQSIQRIEREELPYADGLAYTQDKDRIRNLQREITALQKELDDDQNNLQMP
jgi:hypothetical protein